MNVLEYGTKFQDISVDRALSANNYKMLVNLTERKPQRQLLLNNEFLSDDWFEVTRSSEQMMTVLHDTANIWLKIVRGRKFMPLLIDSLSAVRASLELIGVSGELASLVTVEYENTTSVALLTPHLGISIKDLLANREITHDQAANYYSRGYDLAEQLAHRGFLFIDPNPGNILVRDFNGKVALIDLQGKGTAIGRVTSELLTQMRRDFVKQAQKNRIPMI